MRYENTWNADALRSQYVCAVSTITKKIVHYKLLLESVEAKGYGDQRQAPTWQSHSSPIYDRKTTAMFLAGFFFSFVGVTNLFS